MNTEDIEECFNIIGHGQWGPWNGFSSCSVTCGEGIRHRERNCSNPPPTNGGLDCIGNYTFAETCEIQACPGKTCLQSQTIIFFGLRVVITLEPKCLAYELYNGVQMRYIYRL